MSSSENDRARMRDGTALRQMIGLRHDGRRPDLEPATAFEAVTRQMVLDLGREIHTLRTRIDGLFGVVVGSILLDVLLRLAGWH